MPKFNGHKNWNHWNVSLWLFNDENLYRLLAREIRESPSLDYAADSLLWELNAHGLTHTPDGAPYTRTSIRAAMVGFKWRQ